MTATCFLVCSLRYTVVVSYKAYQVNMYNTYFLFTMFIFLTLSLNIGMNGGGGGYYHSSLVWSCLVVILRVNIVGKLTIWQIW